MVHNATTCNNFMILCNMEKLNGIERTSVRIFGEEIVTSTLFMLIRSFLNEG